MSNDAPETIVHNGVTYKRYPSSKNRARRVYYKGGDRNGDSLHRVIWREANGPIPPDHHIHHKDGNPFNNELSNLECLPAKVHYDHHNQLVVQHKCEECGCEFMGVERLGWHRFCSVRCRAANLYERGNVKRNCAVCGKEFPALNCRDTRFCSRSCSNRGRTLKE